MRPIVLTRPQVETLLTTGQYASWDLLDPEAPEDAHLVVADPLAGVFQLADASGPWGPPLYYPHGHLSERHWLREAWRIGGWNENNGTITIEYRAAPERQLVTRIPADVDPTGERFNDLWVECTDQCHALGLVTDADGQYHWPKGASPLPWRKPRAMPAWASRASLTRTVAELAERRPDEWGWRTVLTLDAHYTERLP